MSKEALRTALKEKSILLSRNNFYSYVKFMAPVILPEGYQDGRHIGVLADEFERLIATADSRVMFWMPPRSMKSRLGSILGPTWAMGKNPVWELMAISYGRELATDFSREVRNLLKTDEYQEVFPGIDLRQDSKAAYRWHINRGGVFTAGGITSGIAGKGAHLAIIDDPLSEQEAFSKASREFVKRWYPGGLRSRLSPGGRILLITTRWHEDDLAGWLLKQQETDELSDRWRVVDVPAIMDSKSSILLKIPEGESYWPERWSKERLLTTKANMPPSQWNALYMQQPSPEEGGILKEEWFQEWPQDEAPKCEYVLQSYDTAFSTKDKADFSAITTWGIFHLTEQPEKGAEIKVPHMILLSAWKARVEFPDLLTQSRKLIKKYKPDACIIEKKASGQSLIQELRRGNVPVIEYKPDRDKMSRAASASAILQNGRVWVRLNRRFTEEFIEECRSFPNAAHDDFVDTFTQAVLWVRDMWKLNIPGDWNYGWKNEPATRKTYWSTL